jgi:hypothetical protein
MRADLHSSHPPGGSLIEGLAQAVSDIASVLQLLGDLLVPRIHTLKKTDRSEPPDVHIGLQPA